MKLLLYSRYLLNIVHYAYFVKKRKKKKRIQVKKGIYSIEYLIHIFKYIYIGFCHVKESKLKLMLEIELKSEESSN